MTDVRAAYLAIAECVRRHGGPAIGGPLAGCELKAFSQNGEDGVLAEILALTGRPAAPSFVEFGVGSGAEGSCVLLADVIGWEGVFLEADAAAFELLARRHRASPRVATVHTAVTPENVDDVFAGAAVPVDLTVLSIDVDGPDLWIWEALQAARPRIVVIEYNAALDPGRRLVQERERAAEPYDGTDWFGASLGALESVGEAKGYRLVHTELTGVNAFFVRDDLPWPADAPVAVRAPNYFLSGAGHAPDPQRRPYLDLDSGELWRPPAGASSGRQRVSPQGPEPTQDPAPSGRSGRARRAGGRWRRG